MPDDDCFLFSEGDGLYEAMADLGEPVAKGDLVARVWPSGSHRAATGGISRPAAPGLVISRHFPGLIKSGDCVAVVGVTSA